VAAACSLGARCARGRSDRWSGEELLARRDAGHAREHRTARGAGQEAVGT
jgi:hypothetical protein